MATSDSQFRIGVIAGGAALVLAIIYLRFCGALTLPAKPLAPSGPHGTSTQLLAQGAQSPQVYIGFLEHDAATAGIKAPMVEDMARKLPYRVDEARHVMEPGKPPIEVAGLRLHLERTQDLVVMVIQNLTDSDVAYEVTSAPSTGGYVCNQARPLPFNAMVIAKGGTETRTECAWRDGMAIIVTRVETLEVPPLSAFYLSELPPPLVGVEDRIARGHKGVATREPCSAVMPAVVRSGLERGDLGWRDLVDFYARHRCQTYQFPSTYRAFKSDGERTLPAI